MVGKVEEDVLAEYAGAEIVVTPKAKSICCAYAAVASMRSRLAEIAKPSFFKCVLSRTAVFASWLSCATAQRFVRPISTAGLCGLPLLLRLIY
jgi:hypothetical protein